MTEGPFDAARTLLVALWLGLVTAAGETVLRIASHLRSGVPYSYTYQVWWMTPVADVAMLLIVALALLLGERIARRRVPPAARLAMLLVPAWMTALLYVPRIAPWALLLVALGLSVQSAHVLRPRLAWFGRLVRWTLPLLLGATLVVALGVELRHRTSERRRALALPPARAGAPNVLLLIWDTVRASSLSLYGNPAPTTPGLEQVARSGIVFDRAMSTAPYTLPSHASLFTGRWANQLSTNWTAPLDGVPPTLAEVLSGNGYLSAGFSANRFYVTEAYGLSRGFVHFVEERRALEETVRSSRLLRLLVTADVTRRVTGFERDLGRVDAAAERDALLRWLARQPPERPYFAFVNFMEAHSPYLPGAPYDTLFGWYDASTPAAERRRLRLLAHHEPEDLPPDVARQQRGAYLGAIAQLDHETTGLLAALDRGGYLRNTIVVIAADHGEEFGEHGQFSHGNSLYLQSLHVPLVISYPGHAPAGVRVDATVSLRDVPSTVLDLAGLPALLPGRSLRRFWAPAAPGTDTTHIVFAEVRRLPGGSADLPVAHGDLASVITDSVQVIRDGSGADSVFDLVADPEGGRQRMADSTEIRRLLDAIPAGRGPGRPPPTG